MVNSWSEARIDRVFANPLGVKFHLPLARESASPAGRLLRDQRKEEGVARGDVGIVERAARRGGSRSSLSTKACSSSHSTREVVGETRALQGASGAHAEITGPGVSVFRSEADRNDSIADQPK
jgi:hypothetical protein